MMTHEFVNPIRVAIQFESDVVMARKYARELARREGLPENSIEALATALSEVARNIVVHAGEGQVLLDVVSDPGRRAVVVVASDNGPGIPNLERALQDGYSTADGLGLGLSGARRLVDEFKLVSTVGKGTTVTMKKWTHTSHRGA
jgi:serine/threonine-protein kinase RsbT